jgi:hypothetical protein
MSIISMLVISRATQRGISVVWLLQFILSFSAIWSGVAIQTFLTRIPTKVDAQRVAEQRVELSLTYLPPRKVWAVWGQALTPLFVLPILQAFALWKALSKRDHGAIEIARQSAEDTVSLLGTRGSLALRGQSSFKRARILARGIVGFMVSGILAAASFIWFFLIWSPERVRILNSAPTSGAHNDVLFPCIQDYEFAQDVLLTKDASEVMVRELVSLLVLVSLLLTHSCN